MPSGLTQVPGWWLAQASARGLVPSGSLENWPSATSRSGRHTPSGRGGRPEASPVRTWELTLALDPGLEMPLFLQLAQAVQHDIRSGRLAPGSTLARLTHPGPRARRAPQHGAGRLRRAALARAGCGRIPPAAPSSPRTCPPRPRRCRRSALRGPGSARAGLRSRAADALGAHARLPARARWCWPRARPDVRLMPRRRAVARVPAGAGPARAVAARLRRSARPPPAARCAGGDAVGPPAASRPPRRRCSSPAAARWRSTSSPARCSARGDVVAVEALGHPGAWAALRALRRLAGARAGRRERPERRRARGAGRAAAGSARSTSRRTTSSRPPRCSPRRAGCSCWSSPARHRMLVIEDDYDHEFHYDGRPVLPLASRGRGRGRGVPRNALQDPRSRAAPRLPASRRSRSSSE